MNRLKKMRKDTLLISIIFVVIGAVLLLHPTTTARTLCTLIAWALIIGGVILVIRYFLKTPQQCYYSNGLIFGLVAVGVGLFMLWQPYVVLSIIPFVLGIVIVVSGFRKLQDGVDLIRLHESGGGWMLLLAGLNILLGVILIFRTYLATAFIFRLLGAGLVFSGITDFVSTLLLSDHKNEF